MNRIGNRIRKALNTAARHALQSGAIKIKGEFYYSPMQREIIVRDRSELSANSRKLDLVAPEEIEATIKIIVSDSLGIEPCDLPREVCKLLGLGRVREDTQKKVKVIADRMVDREELTRKGASLVLADLN